MPVGEKHLFRFGSFELDCQCGQLRRNGIGLKLQGQPIQLLQILLEKAGELVTREELRQHLWPCDTFVDFDHSLNTAVKKLRQALGDEADTPRYIETLPKRGYRFIGQLAAEKSAEQEPECLPSPIEDSPASARPAADVHISTPGRFRLRSSGLAVISVALLTMVVAVYWLTKQPPMPRIVASHALTQTGYPKARGRPQARLVTDGKSIYFQENRPSGLAIMQVGVRGGEVSQLPVSFRDASLRDISKDGELLFAVPDPKTTRYDAWMQPLPSGPARLVVKDTRWPVWTSDGRGILFARNSDSELYRANRDGTDVRRLGAVPDITDLYASPDGARVRFGVLPSRTLWEAGSNGSNPHHILAGHNVGGSAGTWTPDGKYYFFRSWDGERSNLWAASEVHAWWRRKAPDPVQLTFGPMNIGTPVASKDGKQIFVTATEPHGELSVYDSKKGQFVPYLSGLSACYVDFSRDGKWMTYVSFPEGNLWRSRIDGTERRQLTVPPMAVFNPRWSPDGKLIAFMDISGGDRRHMWETLRMYIVSAEGGGPMLVLGGDQNPVDPTWSPNGSAIAYSIGYPFGGLKSEIRILDLGTGKSAMVPGSEGLRSPRWSPDGKYLVALVGESKLMLFSFATHRWQELASGGAVGFPSWTRDSKQVLFADRGRGPFLITLSNRKKQQVATLSSFRTVYAAGFMDWLGLSPDGRPIMTRDTGIEEIYAFDLEYK